MLQTALQYTINFVKIRLKLQQEASVIPRRCLHKNNLYVRVRNRVKGNAGSPNGRFGVPVIDNLKTLVTVCQVNAVICLVSEHDHEQVIPSAK